MRYLATILGILLLCGQAAAQESVPTFKEDGGTVTAEHPYIQPDLQLAPLPLVDFDKLSQPVNSIIKDDKQVKVPDWWPEKPTVKNFDKTFWALTAIWGAGVAADIYTTKSALARGGIESNSFYARDGGKSAAFGLNIAITTTTWGIAALMQSMGWKWGARVLMGYKAGTRWSAAIHNNNILRD